MTIPALLVAASYLGIFITAIVAGFVWLGLIRGEGYTARSFLERLTGTRDALAVAPWLIGVFGLFLSCGLHYSLMGLRWAFGDSFLMWQIAALTMDAVFAVPTSIYGVILLRKGAIQRALRIAFRSIGLDEATDRAEAADAIILEFLESGGTAVLRLDSLESGVIDFASEELRALVGAAPGEIVGRPFMDFVSSDEREHTERVVSQAVASGQRIVGFENGWTHLQTADTVPLGWVQMGDDGRIWRATDLREIIAERKRAKDAEADLNAIGGAALNSLRR